MNMQITEYFVAKQLISTGTHILTKDKGLIIMQENLWVSLKDAA